MTIFILKLTKWLSGKAVRVLVYLLVIFTLFFTYYVVWPKAVMAWKESVDDEQQVKALGSEVVAINRAISEQVVVRDTAKAELNEKQTTLAKLQKKVEEKKQQVSQWRREKIAALQREIRDLQEQRPYFATYRGYPHDAQIKLREGKLVALRNMKYSDPTATEMNNVANQQADLTIQVNSADSAVGKLNNELTDKLTELERLQNTFSLMSGIRLTWRQFHGWILPLVLTFVVVPFIGTLVKFYPMAWLSTRQPPLQFAAGSTSNLYWAPPERTIAVSISPGEKFVARNGFVVGHEEGRKRTQLFWSRKAIATSCASGLVFCTRVPNRTDRPVKVSLSSNDPDQQITEVALEESSEVVLHPSRIIAIQGDVSVRAIWRLTNLHAWLTAQIRFLAFSGPGNIFVLGCGGIEGFTVDGKPQHLEQHLTVGFDSSLLYSVKRTETLIPYIQGKSALFEDRFEGNGVYLRENASQSNKATIADRTYGAIFSVIGKLFGF